MGRCTLFRSDAGDRIQFRNTLLDRGFTRFLRLRQLPGKDKKERNRYDRNQI